MSRPKPATPAVQRSSPFATGLLLVVPFSEGTGTPQILAGTTTASGQAAPPTTVTVVGSPVWTTNTEGTCLQCPTTNDYLQLDQTADAGKGPSEWTPVTAATVCVIRRKLVAGPLGGNSGWLFGTGEGSGAISPAVPFGDGVVYWDFGGTTSPNRLTVSSLSFPTTVERWIFTAGPTGSAIWRNGTKLASQATAITRATTSSSAVHVRVNATDAAGDAQELNYAAVYSVQWDDATCMAWDADPYGLFYPSGPQRSGFGSQKPSRRLMGRP